MYKELSKESKKQVRTKYEKTKKGKGLSATLNRLFIEGAFLIICFFVIVVAIFVADLSWGYWTVAGLTIIFGVIFLVGQHTIRIKEYNKFFSQLSKTEKNQLTKNK